MMRKLVLFLSTACMCVSSPALSQKFGKAGGIGSSSSTFSSGEPSGGTFSINGLTGIGSFAKIVVGSPLTIANGGTGQTSAGGASLDAITGFSGTGILRRTGTGVYSFGSMVTDGETSLMTTSRSTGTVLAAPIGFNGVPSFRALAPSDIPVLNQDTTGRAAVATSSDGLNSTKSYTAAGFQGVLTGVTPNGATSPGLRLRGDTSTGKSLFQITSSDGTAEWGTVTIASNGNWSWNGTQSATSFTGLGTGLTGTAANLSVGGTSTNVTGVIAVANGGTGSSSSGGGALDNISGLASTGVLQRTGSGAYSTLTGAALSLFLPERCRNIVAYGADRTGATDIGAAFNAAVAAQTGNVCVYFPRGTYKLTSALQLTSSTLSTITIMGEGSEATILNQTANDTTGLALVLTGSQQSFHLRDFSVVTNNVGISNVGISITGGTSNTSAAQATLTGTSSSQSDITGVTIRGSDGYGVTNRFQVGILLNRISNVNFVGDAIFGATADGSAGYATKGQGISIIGTSTSLPIAFNIASSQINFYGVGLNYGPYVQGIQIVNSNFTGNGTSINQPASNVGNDELVISGSQFNSGVRNIYTQAPIDGVAITGNMFYTGPNASASVDLYGGQNSVTGNTFHQFSGGTLSTGVNINTYALDSSAITGNVFENLAAGIVLGTGAAHTTVSGNSFNDTTSNIVNNSTAFNDIREAAPASVSGTTGLGTGGAVSLVANSDTVAGMIKLSAGSGSTAATGSTMLGFQYQAPSRWVCTVASDNSGSVWSSPILTTLYSSRNVIQINWTNASAFVANSNYYIAYQCVAR